MENNKQQYNPKIHHRRSIRLKGYDYSKAGLYFITICCQNRICRFGEIVIMENIPTMKLNDAGKMVDEKWLAMVERFPNIELHEYSIMPNHFHCILEIVGDVGDFTNDENGRNDIENGRPQITGRPQGYAPTDTQRDNNETTTGRPQGYAPTDTQRDDTETITGRPQGYAPTDTQRDDVKPKNKTIGDMMDAFKSIVTVEYIHGVKNKGWDRFDGKLLQRDYFEHIIRDEQEYQRISDYIINNPSKWKDDKFYCA
jgi:REP element-mobilizing transposase RayT